MAEASVTTLGRGDRCRSRKSGTVRLALCASTISAIGNPSHVSRCTQPRFEVTARHDERSRAFGATSDVEAGGRVVRNLRQQRPMLMLFADENFPTREAVDRLALPWQAAGSHQTSQRRQAAHVVLQQVGCCSWRGDTRPRGYRITTSKPGRP